jgi:hydroxypyruvate isomerase
MFRSLGAATLGPAATALAAREAQLPFKLSVMLWTVSPKSPIDRRLEEIAQAGYRSVELVSEFTDWSEEEFRRVKTKMRDLGMAFDTIAGNGEYTSKSVGLTDPRERETFLADIRYALKFAQKLECPTMIVFSGSVVEGMPRDAQHASIVEGLKRAAAVVDKHGVTLLVENIDLEEDPKYYLWSVAEGLKIIEEVSHPSVKFLYDCYHEQISEGNLIEKLEKHIRDVRLVHVADVPGRHAPGTGEIDYFNIFRRLAALKYDGYIAMEFLPTGDPVQSLRAARELVLRAAVP